MSRVWGLGFGHIIFWSGNRRQCETQCLGFMVRVQGYDLLDKILRPAMGNAILLSRKKATHAGERSGVPSS